MTNPHKPYFPMFVDLTEKRIVVVGAGTIAKRRIRSPAGFTNNLTVIAPEVNRELLTLQEKGLLSITKKNMITQISKRLISSLQPPMTRS